MRVVRSIQSLLVLLLALWVMAASAAAPAIGEGGVVNAADYTHAFAPGGIISIFGTGLAADVRLAAELPLPLMLGGTSVDASCQGESQPAPLFFVSPGQVNAQLPSELACPRVEVRVRHNGQSSNPMPIEIQPHAPRLFTLSMDGEGQAVLLHPDYRLVSAADPAVPGEWVILYLTGMGAVSPPVNSGQPGGDGTAAGALSHVSSPVAVLVDGVEAEVGYAGLAPYFVGLYQVNLRVPPQTRSGAAHLDLRMPASDSQRGIRFPCSLGGMVVAALPLGSQSGTLATDGATVTITGTGSSVPASIALHQGDLAVTFSGNAAGTRFAISNLPSDFQGQLQVQLSLPGEVAGTSQLRLAVEEQVGTLSLLPVTIVGNSASASIPLGHQATAAQSIAFKQQHHRVRSLGSSQQSLVLLFYLVEDLASTLTGEGTLRLLWDRTIPAQVAGELAIDLDNAYRALRGVGFDLRDIAQTPVDVTLTRFLQLPRDEMAVVRRSALDGQPRISIRPSPSRMFDYFHRQPSDAQLAVRALCFLAQAHFDPLSQFPAVGQVNEWTWMHEAMAYWLMETANRSLESPRRYTFTDVADGVHFPLRGLQYPTDGQVASARQVALHGAGAAPLLQFLRDTLGHTEWLRYIYMTWSPTSSPAARLLAARNDLPDLWRQFLMMLASDGVKYAPFWSEYPSSEALFSYPHMPVLAPRADDSSPSAFRWNAPDLSAALVAIQLENPAPDGRNLRVEYLSNHAPGGALLFVRQPSGANGQALQLLGVARPDRPFELPARDEVLQGVSQVLALLVHPRANPPFTQADDVELRAGFRAFTIASRLQQASLVQVALYGQQLAAAQHLTQRNSTDDHIFSATVQAGVNSGAITWMSSDEGYTVIATESQTFPDGTGGATTRIELQLSPSAERVLHAAVNYQRSFIAHPGTQNETRTDQEWSIQLRNLRFSGTPTDPVFWFDPEPDNEASTVESVTFIEKVNGVTSTTRSGVDWIHNPRARVTFDFIP
jgi:uncharacterized protein (TIGR03437 family)